MTFAFLPDVFKAKEAFEAAEDRLHAATAKVARLRSSPQAPHDPTVLSKARAQVTAAERAISRAKAELDRFGAR